MKPDDYVSFFLSLGILLLSARLLAEVARKLGQPSILGELLAGILLGPTLLGKFAPDAMHFIFPVAGSVRTAFDAFTTLAIALFLTVAGMEVDLSTVWKQGKLALAVGGFALLVPFALGFGAGSLVPAYVSPDLLGGAPGTSPLLFALFLATALAITALPVIAKTLMDIGMYRSDLGMLIIAAAVFIDLAGWVIFSVILSMIGGEEAHRFPVYMTVAATLAYAAAMLTIGRWLIHKTLPAIQAHMSWPAGVLGVSVSLALFGAALTEWIGVHAIFGAFLVGVALGDSSHLRERTRTTMDQFVSFIFAPIFFASIGLRFDFQAEFDGVLILIVLVLGYAGKLIGCKLAGSLFKMDKRENWALGVGMSTHGAMDIILGLLALEAGLISTRLFVALVVVAVITAATAGPLMERILKRKKPKRFTAYVGAKSFIADLKATERFAAILELVPVSGAVGLDLHKISDAVIERERVIPTGLGNGIALPHARIKGLTAPQIAMGISRKGIDFDSPDGEPARIVCVILTPEADQATALELYRDILTTFREKPFREKVLQVKNYTELLALMASAAGSNPGEATIAPASH